MTGAEAHAAYLARLAADPQCTRCGTHTNHRDCPDWCMRLSEFCACRHPLCGECMRRRGNRNLGLS